LQHFTAVTYVEKLKSDMIDIPTSQCLKLTSGLVRGPLQQPLE